MGNVAVRAGHLGDLRAAGRGAEGGGVLLEVESNLGGADAGVAEEFLGHAEFDTLLLETEGVVG
jgi:hypothetical protein